MRTIRSILAALLLLHAGTSAQEPDAVALFLKNCASCHGETGDGNGTQTLDRQARSFKDGGFSYGNTPKALYRTISSGIPGTPMPGFDTSLTEAERHALANYVTTLGPDTRDVTVEETIMVVGDRPRVVRGMLPPIDTGAVSHTRGLLLGTVRGLTFEYRIDDVRLLGVRQGAFVERTDWSGRGGTGLKPLGKVVHLEQGGNPEPFFALAIGDAKQSLRAAFAASWIQDKEVGLAYWLEGTGAKQRLAQVTESVDAYGGSVGAGFRRRFELTSLGEERSLVVEAPRRNGSALVASFLSADPSGSNPDRHWNVVKRRDDLFECTGAVLIGGELHTRDGQLHFDIKPETSTALHTITILTPAWSEEVKNGLAEVSFP